MTDPTIADGGPPSPEEAEYLRRYPDVVAAMAQGRFKSGREHFERYGRAEGRSFSARLGEQAHVVFGPVSGFTPALPGPPRHAVEGILIAEDGWIFVVGWTNDLQEPLTAVRVEGRDWTARVEAAALARVPRADVQQALNLQETGSPGFILLIRAGSRLSPSTEVRVTLEWKERSAASTVPARMVGLQEMLGAALIPVARGAETNGTAMLALDAGFSEQVAALNRAVTSGMVRNPFVERFGDRSRAPKASIVVCLYGRPEYLFLQNALFANRPGIEDMEFIYVCNSPELLERLLKDAASGTTIYGLRQTVVGLSGNAGFAAANNVGAGMAQSGRLVCLNPDVLPRDPDWAARHASIVEGGGPGTRLFGAALFYDDGALMHGGMYFELDTMIAVRPGYMHSARFARVEHYGKGAPPDTAGFLRPRPVPAVSGAFISVDRGWFETLGGFPEDYVFGHYEDADFCLRSLEAGTPAWLQDLKMWHLEGQGSRGSSVMAGATHVNRTLFSRRWRGLIAERLHGPDARPELLAADNAVSQAAE